MTTINTPDWAKNAVFYQIFPDRFAKSASVHKPSNLEPWDEPPTRYGFKGGDLIGVVEHLDYLEELGINAIYFNPIFQSAANHRYHTHDYRHVDPILGGDDAFRALLDAAHERGFRVIIDGVFNHASRGFFQFNHLLECGPASPYVDWFNVDEWPLNAYDPRAKKPNYQAWWDLPALPEFNTDTPAVRDFIFDIAEKWIHFGADGWRLDVPADIDDDGFWQAFRQRVKAIRPDAYLVGEIWDDATRWLQGDQFDAVMNYSIARAALGFLGRETIGALRHGPYRVPPLEAPEFAEIIEHNLSIYDWEIVQVQLNLLGSHDTPRYLSMVDDDESAVQLSILMQMTLPGAPCIYYGDELGLTGGYDPGCRSTIPWEDIEAYKGEIWQATKDAVALRRAHPVLRHGHYETMMAEDDVVAYTRTLEEDGTRALVILNARREEAPLTLPVGGLTEVAFGAPSAATLSESEMALTVPPRSGVVLV